MQKALWLWMLPNAKPTTHWAHSGHEAVFTQGHFSLNANLKAVKCLWACRVNRTRSGSDICTHCRQGHLRSQTLPTKNFRPLKVKQKSKEYLYLKEKGEMNLSKTVFLQHTFSQCLVWQKPPFPPVYYWSWWQLTKSQHALLTVQYHCIWWWICKTIKRDKASHPNCLKVEEVVGEGAMGMWAEKHWQRDLSTM